MKQRWLKKDDRKVIRQALMTELEVLKEKQQKLEAVLMGLMEEVSEDEEEEDD